ncbi:MAG: toll/interleukin-1 receptor domain-containing protein [Candidatus Omnitrophota bacterium]
MEGKDIKTLIKILTHRWKKNLANLLEGCYSEIDESGTFGSFANSVISTFLIYAPLEKFYKLKELKENEKRIIFNSVLDIYPPAANSIEITSVEFRLQQESTDNSKSSESNSSQSNQFISIFVSYSHKDRNIAGQIKESLEYLGFDVFLAHEDIKPSTEWQERILKELRTRDVFLAVLTDEFRGSEWTGQETGIAFAADKLIIALKVSIDPFGFISKFQALKFNKDIVSETSREIIHTIAEKKDITKLINSLIQGFSKSRSYTEANEKVVYLKKLESKFNEDQIMEIIRASFNNSQISDEEWNAGPYVRGILTNNKNKKQKIIKIIKNDLKSHFSKKEADQVDDKYVIGMIRVRLKVDLDLE